MNLNKNELNVLKAIVDNAQDAAGGDFGFTDEVVAGGVGELSENQVKGYLSVLNDKGLVYIDKSVVDNRKIAQTTFSKETLDVLIENDMINEEYAKKFEAWYY